MGIHEQLISHEYLAAQREMHAGEAGYGGSGWKQHENIVSFAKRLKIKTMLDYGCGEGTLRKYLLKEAKAKWRILEYDPGIPKKWRLPTPADLVVCTDVLEHVEPDKLSYVLAHLNKLMLKGCYLAIATRPANKKLPDGRNAHLIVENAEWWHKQIGEQPWMIERVQDVRKGKDQVNGAPHEVRFWLTHPSRI